MEDFTPEQAAYIRTLEERIEALEALVEKLSKLSLSNN